MCLKKTIEPLPPFLFDKKARKRYKILEQRIQGDVWLSNKASDPSALF